MISTRACSLLRRLGAMTYDALLVLALWMLATFPVVVIGNHGVDSANIAFQLYLAIVALTYFHLSWRMQGQTLGMRAWKIHLEFTGPAWTLARSMQRAAGGTLALLCIGAGYVQALFRHDRRTWSDQISKSIIVDLADTSSAPHQPKPDAGE